MNLNNDEKLMLGMIMDEAETKVRREREVCLRSGDSESQHGTINALTRKLEFIEKMQLYSMQMEGVVVA